MPPLTISGRRRTGKIARLPLELRETVNLMLQDGIPYAAILEKLGPHASGMNYHSLKRWRKGGYLDWLRDKERLEIARILQETVPADKLRDALACQTSLQMFQFLVDLQRDPDRRHSAPPLDTVVRIANALPRLSPLRPLPGNLRKPTETYGSL